MLDEEVCGVMGELRGTAATPDTSQAGLSSRRDLLRGGLGIVLLILLPGVVCMAGSVIGDSGLGLLLALGMVVVVCGIGLIADRMQSSGT